MAGGTSRARRAEPRLDLRGKECWETETEREEEQEEHGEMVIEAYGHVKVIGGDSTEGSSDRDKR